MPESRQLFHRLSLSSRYGQFSEPPSLLLYWWTGRCIMHARLQLSPIILLIPRTYAAWLSIYRTPFTHRATSMNRAARDQEMLHVTNTVRVHRPVYSPSTHARRHVHPLLHSQQKAQTMEEPRNTTSNYSLQQEPTSVCPGPRHVEQWCVKAFRGFLSHKFKRKIDRCS